MNNTALIVIDIQNDYFPNGRYPLWNTQQTLEKVIIAMDLAQKQAMPIILIQHISDVQGLFSKGSIGADLHPEIAAKSTHTQRLIKTYADSFEQTELTAILQTHQADSLLICGMMTQNCVTHTALSKAAEPYQVAILQEACTTVDERIHSFALNALSSRLPLKSLAEAF